MSDQKYRLITRADFDGVVSGALLQELELVDDVLFVEPNLMQDGKVAVSDRDITANLPYVDGVHLCFDHHVSEASRVGQKDNLVIDPDAASAARVVWDHYGGESRFPLISTEMMEAVDKADMARYTIEEILAPDRWTLLNFVTDPRTGLSRFGDFSISHDEMMLDLMTYCRHTPIDEILELKDVEERVHRYIEHKEFAEHQIERNAVSREDVVVVDYRSEDMLYAGNRFMVYALHPECKVSIFVHVEDADRVSFACGKSIINRSAKVNIGELMLEYGGGGHRGAGTCRVPNADAERVLGELVAKIQAAG